MSETKPIYWAGARGFQIPIPPSVINALRLVDGETLYTDITANMAIESPVLLYSRTPRQPFVNKYRLTGSGSALFIGIPAKWVKHHRLTAGAFMRFETKSGDMIIRAIKEDCDDRRTMYPYSNR